MYISNYQKQSLRPRLVLITTTTVFFVASFVLNLTSDQALYQVNLNVVPGLQENSVMGSHGFMVFMNVVSLVFDPNICAAYIFLIYLVTYRKLEIVAFLLWFFGLAWLLGILKMVIHQARPFWVPGTQVKMESWTCYTDYGCPSGHSMLAIVLLEFLLRFFYRVHRSCSKLVVLGYVAVFGIELLVMFSRVMLGMHSLNEVLFGLSIGLYSFIPYYLFVERRMMKLILYIFTHQKSIINNLMILAGVIVFNGIALLVALVPAYDNTAYFEVIAGTPGCEKVKQYSGFQYNGLTGTTIIMAAFGTLLAMNYMTRPYNLAKTLAYSRLSPKFVGRFLLTLVLAVIPLAVFLNPLWNRIQTRSIGEVLIKWACQAAAFFLATFSIIFVSPLVGERLGLEDYNHPTSYRQFKQYEAFSILELGDNHTNMGPRETELTGQMSDFKATTL